MFYLTQDTKCPRTATNAWRPVFNLEEFMLELWNINSWGSLEKFWVNVSSDTCKKEKKKKKKKKKKKNYENTL